MTALSDPVLDTTSRTVAFQPPSHWNVKPLLYLFESVGGATPSKQNDDYWVGEVPWVSPKDMKTPVIQDSEDHISEIALRETGLTLLPPLTILIVVRGMILAHTIPVALATREVTINQDMKGLLPKKEILSEYLAHLLRAISPLLFSTVEEAGHGTRCLRLDLWRNILVGFPHQEEQRRILDFIDRKTFQIDTLIAKKKRQTELLGEKRRALISESVRRGFNRELPFKDSGVEWLGEIPGHWSVQRLKYSITKVEQGWSPQCDNRPATEGEWGVLKVGCVNGYLFDPNEQKALPPELEPLPAYEIKKDDILMSRGNTRELVGSASLVRDVRSRLLLCDLLYRFRADFRKADPEFIVLSLRSPHVRYQIESEATGTSSSMKKIGQETLRELLICLPPLDEQRDILVRLKPLLRQIDVTVSLVENHIEKLREYRQALVSAAITGQIDVQKETA